MTYEVVPTPEDPSAWLVEAIDREGEGEIFSTLFYGTDAEKRAREYATWKSAQSGGQPVSEPLQRQRP